MTRLAFRLFLLLSLAWTPAAFAQGVGIGGAPGGSGVGSHDDAEPKTPVPPPAIPGAVSSPDRVAPAPKNAGDLDPNAALFDAIDRGDLAAAREALGRGADLDARNVLGQRPIDMSIDLDRNDITFLLLSMRSQNGDEAPASDGADAGGSSLSTADQAALANAPAPVRATPNGGTPLPRQGFLGFGK